jgi:hypothetical protein
MRCATTLLIVTIVLSGCVSYDFLDPRGNGKSFTVANPCPYPYRVLQVRSKNDQDLRITINVFRSGEYGLKSTTLFVVTSDVSVFGYQIGQFHLPIMHKNHHVSFPDGPTVIIAFPNGTATKGQFNITYDGLLLSYPISPSTLDSFVVTLPRIEVDGEIITLGEVTFKRDSATLYAINC